MDPNKEITLTIAELQLIIAAQVSAQLAKGATEKLNAQLMPSPEKPVVDTAAVN
jgi:hypothetical protein